MTAKSPPIPPDQLPARARDLPQKGQETGHHTGEGQAGNADINWDEQGRYGNIRQNVNDVQHKVQDR